MTCDCEFDEYEEGDEDYGEESWHYRRTCLHCGHRWWGLHCPHDGRQNSCPSCGIDPAVVVADAATRPGRRAETMTTDQPATAFGEEADQ